MRRSWILARFPRLVALVALAVVFWPFGSRERAEPRDGKADDVPVRRLLRVRVVDADKPALGVGNATMHVFPLGGHPRLVWEPGTHFYATRTTGTDGRTSLTVPTRASRWAREEGLYLQVRAPGFMLARRVISAVEWTEAELVVPLRRGSVVRGRVLQADGTPAVGASVAATQPEHGGWSADPSTSTTDADGAFRLSGLFPGWVAIEATYKAGDAAWASKAIVDVEDTVVEVRLPADPARRLLCLVVKTEDGALLREGYWLAVRGPGPAPSGDEVQAPPDSYGDVVRGEATLPAVPSLQYVVLMDSSSDPTAASGSIVVGPLGGRGGTLEVVMPKTVQLRGTLRDQFGEPFREALIVAYPVYRDGAVERAARSSPCATTSVWRDGTFRLDGAPATRIEVGAHTVEGLVESVRMDATSGPVHLVGQRMATATGTVLHPDGRPARDALVYARLAGAGPGAWQAHPVGASGIVTIWRPQGQDHVVRTLLPPTGVEEAAASEIRLAGSLDEVTLAAPGARSLTVRVPDWPREEPGLTWVMNGPRSRPRAAWIIGGVARFEGLPAGSTLSILCTPLLDGRIAFRREVSPSEDEVSLPLVASRTIRGLAHGIPHAAQPESVWADTSEFVAEGHLAEDGRFVVRGVPRGACRVCVVFRLGADRWVGAVRDEGAATCVRVEVQRIGEDALDAWIYPRPAP